MSEEMTPANITTPYDQYQVSSVVYWIESNGYKPHLLVDRTHEGLRVPAHLQVGEDLLALNVNSTATHRMQWFDDRMEFNARFGGKDFRLIVPYHAIKMIQFAHTSSVIPMPWMNFKVLGEGVQLRPVPEAPTPKVEVATPHAVRYEDGATINRQWPYKETAEEAMIDPPPAPATPVEPIIDVDNVRVVDFRAPRKPRN